MAIFNMVDKEKMESIKAESADIPAGKTTDTVSEVSSVKAKTKVEKKAVAKKPSVKSSAAKTSATKVPSKKKTVKKTAAEIKKANDAIRVRESVEDLKRRAAAAKKRAQEKILQKSYVSDPVTDPLERLADTFHQSARRWEMVVYPSLFAFVLLASYGFFLIYRLTHDISILSHSVTRMAVIVSEAMPKMSKDMDVMTGSIDSMTNNISGMSREVSAMSGQMETLTPLSRNISSMTGTMNEMNRSVYGMQRDMGGMNRTISSGPFGMMNDVMPFSSHTNVVPPPPPPTYRQPWEVQPREMRRIPPRAPAQMVPVQKIPARSAINTTPDKNNGSVMNINKNTETNKVNPVKHKKITSSPDGHGAGLVDHSVISGKR